MSRAKDVFCPTCGTNEKWKEYLLARIGELEEEIRKTEWMLNEMITEPAWLAGEMKHGVRQALEDRYIENC